MKWACLQLTVLVLAITYYPGLPPDMKFEPFQVEFGELEGPLKLNNKLNAAEKLFKDEVKGPEDLLEYKNELYMTTHGGYVQKLSKAGKLIPIVKFGKSCDGIWQEHICGRPLGIKIDAAGNLYAADAYYGIKKVNLTTGEVESLVDISKPIDNTLPRIPNSVDVSKFGHVYWTDSSTSHALHDGLFTLLGNGNGRVLKYDPAKRTSTVLLKDLHFANGLKLSDDETFLIVAETFKSRVLRYYISGEKKGTFDVLVGNLPGFPDNINRLPDGNYVVSLIIPPNVAYKYLTGLPTARKFLARSLTLSQNIFKQIQSVYQHQLLEKIIHWIGHFEMLDIPFHTPRASAVIFNKHGNIIDSLHNTDGSVSHISSVAVYHGYYYLGSPFNPYLARVKISK